MSDQRLKIAVFIDFDNVEIGVKTTLGRQFDVGAVLEAVKERGEIITKIAYGDWKRAGDHGRAMAQHAVRLVQRVMTPGGDKNGADINLALDALEMAFTHDHINAFVIVGGDSDFITLVEKLKQYDKKVFVIGGRAFTSQVMQKNCTEFIAYENVANSGGHDHRQRTASRSDRPGSSRAHGASSSLDQALPLVQRALKVLNDREVSPQLGLLKSTLLQLDSSFSERDYGASTFRDFADKLEQRGLVTLKHSGRTTVVELSEAGAREQILPEPIADNGDGVMAVQAPRTGEEEEPLAEPAVSSGPPELVANLEDGVALVRAILAEATTPPRWPMYLRQMKQFIRNARPDFDERRYGSLPDLMRACQKEGLLRLERDRQGGLRAFSATGGFKPASQSQSWQPPTQHADDESMPGNVAPPASSQAAGDDQPSVQVDPDRDPSLLEPDDDQLAMFGKLSPTDPEPAAVKRGARARKIGVSPSSRIPAIDKVKRARKVAAPSLAAAPRPRRAAKKR
ncbi:MAG TPA: NYN domain-containing protein [Vicinamibacterales bacterium]|nr:NYN domain-containing protein [Vicinamibacterales bacterium]